METLLLRRTKRCNDVLKTLPLATDIPADEQTTIIAQAKFWRAFYHFELKKIFGNIPYADENLTVDNTTNTVDVWPNIEADLNDAIVGYQKPGSRRLGK